MNNYIPFNEHDVTIIKLDNKRTFPFSLWINQNEVAMLIRFDYLTKERYLNTQTSVRQSLFLQINHIDNVLTQILDSNGTAYHNSSQTHKKDLSTNHQYSIITTDIPTERFKILTPDKHRKITENVQYFFGFYNDVLHLFAKKINAGTSNIYSSIDVELYQRTPLAMSFDIENSMTIFTWDFDLNNPKKFTVIESDIEVLNTDVYPKAEPFQIREDLNAIINTESFFNQNRQMIAESYSFLEAKMPVKYHINSYNYFGNFVQKTNKLKTRTANNIRYIGATSARPTNDVEDGFDYYDTTIKTPLYKFGNEWRSSDGVLANTPKIGDTSNRPSSANYIYVGFPYYDTSISRFVWWNGSNWSDPTARATETVYGTVKKAATQANSTATSVAGLLADFNALLQKLKDAGVMS